MADTTYSVGEVARIAKVTIRTLHHYDQIGLLTPSDRTRAGYRLYTRGDVDRLQQIRFHRELGLALEEIRSILDAQGFDPEEALREHRKKLVARIEETRALVDTIDRMLTTKDEGENMSPEKMTAEELFDGFQPEEHQAEAKERWGNTAAWKESSRRTKSYGPEQWRAIKEEAAALVQEMAVLQSEGIDPGSQPAIAIAERHRLHIDRWFYPCSHQMHQALGSMYVTDPRFAESLDRHGEGLSGYFEQAIQANQASRPATSSPGAQAP